MSNATQIDLVKGTHESVMAMVRDHLADDPDFVGELSEQLKERELVKTLAILRTRAELSQKELAIKAGCKQPRISKLESGADADVRFGDVLAYLKATGHEARVVFLPATATLADEVKMHGLLINKLLSRMVDLAGDDASIVKGVARFIEDAQCNLARLAQLATNALPNARQQPPRLVEVEAPRLKKDDEPEAGIPVEKPKVKKEKKARAVS
jgi:transcriptional regulator with XRE-family HTH domain